jgi:phosphoglycolate phosphatase-like HAD superfamily hydrolase
MYASISRGRSNDVMRLYDVPAPLAHIPMRQPTLNPLQALFVMNSSFVQEQAKALAEHVAGETTTEAKIQSLYRKVFSRNATPDEMALGVKYLAAADTARYAQALLSTNEVIFWP